MPFTFICANCGKIAIINPRLKKKQKYCSDESCQQARRRTWKKKQYDNNAIYRKNTLENQKVWRKCHQHDQYQHQYRERHPGYLERNVKLQKIRNKKRQTEHSCVEIQKSALLLHPDENGTFLLLKIKKNVIVNRNALALQPSVGNGYVLFKIKPEKIVNRNAFMVESQY